MKYIRLNLDFYHPWANNAGYYLARSRGFYEEEGIDLDITSFDPYRDDSLHRLIRGEIDIACNYPQRLMLHTQKGDQAVSVAAVNSTTFESLIFDDRNPIGSVKDLEGKTIGTPRSPRVREVLRYLMEKNGVDPEAVKFVEYYPAEPDPLIIETGEIDAVWGSYWAWEGVLSKLRNPHISWFQSPELGAPFIHNQVLAVRKQTADSDENLIRAFLKATKLGFAAAAADPEEAATVMIKAAPMFTAEDFKAAVTACVPTWNLDNWGSHDMENIQSYASWLKSRNLLKSDQGHLAAFTQAFLP